MRITRLALVALGAATLAAGADQPAPTLEVSHTERVEFPTGGTLKLVNSSGELNVEAWDQPGVEITTVKSLKPGYNASDRDKATHELELLHVTVERRGNELVITTDSPKNTHCDIEYRIKAPGNAKLIASHRVGEVYVDGLTNDIDVTVRRGDIFLHLPEEAQYNTSAKVDLGSVYTDYAGRVERLWWCVGHRVETGKAPAPHQLNLKSGYGDIMILKTWIAKSPESKM